MPLSKRGRRKLGEKKLFSQLSHPGEELCEETLPSKARGKQDKQKHLFSPIKAPVGENTDTFCLNLDISLELWDCGQSFNSLPWLVRCSN